MQTFTGWQYLLIDLANAYGLDKLNFEPRMEWAMHALKADEATLHAYTQTAKHKPLFIKALMAIKQVQSGRPSGHLVGMDACCSGIQVMSALTGCVVGATNTGLVDPDQRMDAYQITTDMMNEELDGTCKVPRDDAKDALMTSYYGSKRKPKEIFGVDTAELSAFYVAMGKVAPGAWELLQDLLASWQPGNLMHKWQLPDGFEAVVKVMVDKTARIEVDELNHSTFTYEFYVNEGTDSGLSNVANVVHSVDAYVLRSMHRRCNYDVDMLNYVAGITASVLDARGQRLIEPMDIIAGTKIAYYIEQFNRSGMADVVILPYLSLYNIDQLSTAHLQSLQTIMKSMLKHKPFPLVTVHDEFKAHANNMNHVRQHYINIFADLAESNLLSDLLSQIHGTPGTFKKLSNNLGDLIRKSNYALS